MNAIFYRHIFFNKSEMDGQPHCTPQPNAVSSLLRMILDAPPEQLKLIASALKLNVVWSGCLCKDRADVLQNTSQKLNKQSAKKNAHDLRYVEFVIAENQRAKDRAKNWAEKQAAFAAQKQTAAPMKKVAASRGR
jgi:hypothetical protein